MGENEIYAAIGSAGLERLCAAFYRQVPNDELLGPMYPADDWAGAEQRLRDFLIYRFGGPQTYIAERGHPRLRGRHAPFAIDRQRWGTHHSRVNDIIHIGYFFDIVTDTQRLSGSFRIVCQGFTLTTTTTVNLKFHSVFPFSFFTKDCHRDNL